MFPYRITYPPPGILHILVSSDDILRIYVVVLIILSLGVSRWPLVGALVSGASGQASTQGHGHCLVFLRKTLYTVTMPLSTQVYKWVRANVMLGVTL